MTILPLEDGSTPLWSQSNAVKGIRGHQFRHSHHLPTRLSAGWRPSAHALATHLERIGADIGIVGVVDSRAAFDRAPVVEQLARDEPDRIRTAARALNTFDIVIIQHEYGIYAGPDGVEVLALLAAAGPHDRRAAHRAHRAHAGSATSWSRSSARPSTRCHHDRHRARPAVVGYGRRPAKVVVIPHGPGTARAAPARRRPIVASGPPTLLTWGLLGPGKGIEWAIAAMAGWRPAPGAALPVVGADPPEGPRARRRAPTANDCNAGWTSWASREVEFDGRLPRGPRCTRRCRRADVVLLPYDSREQVTSGVLTEAVAAGKPVVSTSFPHAVELLSSGAGLLVPPTGPRVAGATRCAGC